ncbi:CvpA family protein [candidate division WOR-3 bacterium]|nr:CvpA family protein [candidate division WOR-3 bacterium]
MAVDVIIILFILGFMVSGYYSGLIRRFCSLLFPSLGLLIGLRNQTVVSPAFDRFLHNYPASAFFAFLVLVAATWLGLRFVRRVLLKLLDWSRLEYLDIFLGGIFGLAKGLAVVWLGLAFTLVVFPPSVRVFSRSSAAMRVLALADKVLDTRSLLSCGVERLMSRTAGQIEEVGSVLRTGSQLGRSLNLLRTGAAPYR